MREWFIKILNNMGRFIEMCLTGQTDFSITTTDFKKSDIIDNTVQAKLVHRELRNYLRNKFDIDIKAPVIINLEKPKTRSWKQLVFQAGSHIGSYRLQNLGSKISHEINIEPGLERRKFKAVLGHELAHAYQAESNILRAHNALREGMSRWIEYHILLEVGLTDEAQKLKRYRSYILGRGLLTILDYEKNHGLKGTIEWLKKL